MNARPQGHSWLGGGAPRLRNSRNSLQRLASAQGGGLFVALVLLSLYFSVATGSFFTRSNILVVLEQISVLGIVAVPGAMLLVSHDVGFVHQLRPDRVLLMPDGTEDSWSDDLLDLVAMA